MSNSIAPGSSVDVNVKITALTTNPNVPVTYKTIILKKNLVNGINILTQEMMSVSNTKYVIKYDYALSEDITVPDNCILEFDGGSIANGTITNTYIVNISNKPILKNITIVTPIKQEVYLKWFDYASVANAITQAAKFGIVNADGEWVMDADVVIKNDINLYNGIFKCRHGNVYNFIIKSTDFITTAYSETIAANSNSINIGYDNSQYKYVILKSSDKYVYCEEGCTWYDKRHGTCGEALPIFTSKAGSTTFRESRNIVAYNTNITVTFVKPINVTISNCSFIADNVFENVETQGELLNIKYAIANISNCSFKGCSTGCHLVNCFDSIVTGCKFADITWGCAFSDATFNSILSNSSFKRHRHAFTTLGELYITKHNLIEGNICADCNAAIMSHANAYGTVITNNTISNSPCGVGSMAPNCTIIGNTICDFHGTSTSRPITILEAGGINCTIQNNVIKDNTQYADGGCIFIQAYLDKVTTAIISKDCIVKGNTIVGNINSSGVYINSDTSYKVSKATVEDNIISHYNWGGIGIFNIVNLYLINNCISNPQSVVHGIISQIEYLGWSRLYAINNIITGTSDVDISAIEISQFGETRVDNNKCAGYSKLYGGSAILIIGFPDTSGARPTHPVVGQIFFDNNLSTPKPIWYKGRKNDVDIWVDATGTPV